jgi:hypothetical protein
MSSFTQHNNLRSSKFYKTYLNDKATYPLFIIMGCAAVLVVFAGGRTLFRHPDVYVTKEGRGSIIRDNTENGTRHSTNWSHHNHTVTPPSSSIPFLLSDQRIPLALRLPYGLPLFPLTVSLPPAVCLCRIRSMARTKNDNDTVTVFPSLNKALLGKHINPSAQATDDDEE